MSTNIITPALLIFNVVMSYFPELYDPALGEEQAANRQRATDVAQYLVSASLICSDIGTMMQVSTIPIPFTNYQLGTGVLSTMGTANQYNAIFPVILYDIMSRGYDIEEAWGKLLGTIMVCVWLEAFISFIPYKILNRICPPYVFGSNCHAYWCAADWCRNKVLGWWSWLCRKSQCYKFMPWKW